MLLESDEKMKDSELLGTKRSMNVSCLIPLQIQFYLLLSIPNNWMLW